MTTRKPERGAPGGSREPYNVPIRFYGAEGKARRGIRGKKPASRHDLIKIKFGVQGGNPVIKGTRVPVRVVIAGLGAGESIKAICRAYRISRPAVLAALAYAAEVLSREDVIEILGDVGL